MNFKRGREPYKALKLGYGSKTKTKAWKVLEFIGSFGKEGVRLTDIQRYIYEELNKAHLGKDYFDKKWTSYKWTDHYQSRSEVQMRASRGYWTSALYGDGYHRAGLLNKYCYKNDKNKWVLDRMPGPGENIYENMKKLVCESLDEMFYEDEAFVFQQNMAKLEAELEELNPQAWEKFEESSGELWRELEVENWQEAFKQDPMACYAFKQELESTVNVFK